VNWTRIISFNQDTNPMKDVRDVYVRNELRRLFEMSLTLTLPSDLWRMSDARRKLWMLCIWFDLQLPGVWYTQE
jgi:hypothetical protein